MEFVEEQLDQAPFLRLDEPLVTDLLVTSLREEVEKAGFHKVILGLSGGIDSALSLYLATEAFGKENVIAVCMPYHTSDPASLEDAQVAIEELGVHSLIIDITPQIDPYFDEHFPEASPLRRGNKMARERMSILYDLSVDFEALVVGTSNRTELLLGYGTQYGDGASAVNPIGDLYKTQVRQLSAFLGVPEQIIIKPPSADLWENQTDEGELGFTYLDVDRLLYYMIDKRYTLEQLSELQFTEDFISQVSRRIIRNQYKRTMPIILKVNNRTIGTDFRYPRDWGL
ncbi:NAD+ synthase [Hazenella coriacea]|uniref:NH(3)-dependent NAD(+) synthetase n=1 Tax=Hazenella coriacea TaxID=1179467 RepID=A0A4R3LDT2_9BACL|nr:NAD+ synthase [Hazenella coriacea]TCS96474.1 NH(3)-dependent NAD(+) synthetase [Hazenella coriacea]